MWYVLGQSDISSASPSREVLPSKEVVPIVRPLNKTKKMPGGSRNGRPPCYYKHQCTPFVPTMSRGTGDKVGGSTSLVPAEGSGTGQSVTKGNAFEMPTGLPEALKEAVIVPKVDAYSLHASIRYVANKIGYSYSQSGPDFSLLDTKVPFAEPVPAYEFLWYAGNVRGLPISVGIHGSGSIVVTSKKP